MCYYHTTLLPTPLTPQYFYPPLVDLSGLNSKLYWENDDINHTVSLVPTSAHSGEGVPDLLMMLITLTQERQVEKLMYMESVQCTVLEVSRLISCHLVSSSMQYMNPSL